MEKRRGPSISVKMILATTTIIVLIVAFFGVVNIYTLNDVFKSAADTLQDQTEKNLANKGNNVGAALGASTRAAVLNNDWQNLQASIPEVWKKDPELHDGFLYVADDKGLVQASAEQAMVGRQANDAAWLAVKGTKEPVTKNRVKVKIKGAE